MKQKHFPIHDILLAALRGEAIPQGRHLDLVWCRHIMSHSWRPKCKNLEQVGAKIGKSHSLVSYYLKKYNEEYKYNPIFRVYAEWFKKQQMEKYRVNYVRGSNGQTVYAVEEQNPETKEWAVLKVFNNHIAAENEKQTLEMYGKKK